MGGNRAIDNLPARIREGGLPVVRSNEELNELVHRVFTPDKFNVLVPQTMSFGVATKTKVVFNLVVLNPSTGAGGDYWPISGRCILRSKAINRIAGEANIQWDPRETKTVDKAYEKGKLIRAEFRAVAFMLGPEGVTRSGIGCYEYNYYNDLDDPKLRESVWDPKARKKVKTANPDMKTIKQRQRFGIQLAETGAKNRAVFNILGIMEKSLSKDDIHKPFVVPCVVPEIDMDDPAIKQMIARQAVGAAGDIYGPGAVDTEYSVDPSPQATTPPFDPATGEMVDDDPTPPAATNGTPPDDIPTGEQPSTPTDGKPSPEDIRKEFAWGWEDASQEQRGNKIVALAGQAKVDISTKAPPADWPKATQMKWLIGLAEKVGEVPCA